MKLLKFNLIFIPFLALCLGLVGYTARRLLLDDARQHVIQNARIIMKTMLSSRGFRGDVLHAGSIPSVVSSPSVCSQLD